MAMDPRYPVGKFVWPQEVTADDRRRMIAEIAEAPAKLRAAVAGRTDGQLDTPYRDGGWTVRQVVHHLPDSHLNAYIRFKLALTEQEPTIKPYEQQLWAELPDSKTAPIDMSLDLLESLHRRWVLMLRAMTPADFARTLRHPELGVVRLDRYLASYAWHGRHHVAHITELRKAKGW
ncbi:MAG: YfiT family bacillithiol transferase [Terriglobia bacterium]